MKKFVIKSETSCGPVYFTILKWAHAGSFVHSIETCTTFDDFRAAGQCADSFHLNNVSIVDIDENEKEVNPGTLELTIKLDDELKELISELDVLRSYALLERLLPVGTLRSKHPLDYFDSFGRDCDCISVVSKSISGEYVKVTYELDMWSLDAVRSSVSIQDPEGWETVGFIPVVHQGKSRYCRTFKRKS